MALCRGALGLCLLCLLCLLLLPAAVLGEDCQAYTGFFGEVQPAQSCPRFCCGSCLHRYCCSNALLKFNEQNLRCNQLNERMLDLDEHLEASKKISEELRELGESLSNNWLG